MKSSVEQVINFKKIPIKSEMLIIEIPSWDAVAQPLLNYGKKQVQQATGQPIETLQDYHLVHLELPVETVEDLIHYGTEVYKQSQIQSRFYYEILPYILTYYSENSQVHLDQAELERYVTDYLNQVQAYANQENLTIEEYGRKKMDIKEEDVEEVFKQRGREDFIFKVIAQKHYQDKGGTLTKEDYEMFIQKNVLENNADEIELRERFSFTTFKASMPEMSLSQEIYDYFVPQITFQINPEAEFSYR